MLNKLLPFFVLLLKRFVPALHRDAGKCIGISGVLTILTALRARAASRSRAITFRFAGSAHIAYD